MRRGLRSISGDIKHMFGFCLRWAAAGFAIAVILYVASGGSNLIRYNVTLWQVALVYLGVALTASVTLGLLRPMLVTRLGRGSAAIVICVITIGGVSLTMHPDLPLRWLLGGSLVAGVLLGPLYAWAYGPLEGSNDDSGA